MNKFDFTKAEYDNFIDQCPFSEDEVKVLTLRRRSKSITYMARELNCSERTINRRIKNISKKILRVI